MKQNPNFMPKNKAKPISFANNAQPKEKTGGQPNAEQKKPFHLAFKSESSKDKSGPFGGFKSPFGLGNAEGKSKVNIFGDNNKKTPTTFFDLINKGKERKIEFASNKNSKSPQTKPEETKPKSPFGKPSSEENQEDQSKFSQSSVESYFSFRDSTQDKKTFPPSFESKESQENYDESMNSQKSSIGGFDAQNDYSSVTSSQGFGANDELLMGDMSSHMNPEGYGQIPNHFMPEGFPNQMQNNQSKGSISQDDHPLVEDIPFQEQMPRQGNQNAPWNMNYMPPKNNNPNDNQNKNLNNINVYGDDINNFNFNYGQNPNESQFDSQQSNEGFNMPLNESKKSTDSLEMSFNPNHSSMNPMEWQMNQQSKGQEPMMNMNYNTEFQGRFMNQNMPPNQQGPNPQGPPGMNHDQFSRGQSLQASAKRNESLQSSAKRENILQSSAKRNESLQSSAKRDENYSGNNNMPNQKGHHHHHHHHRKHKSNHQQDSRNNSANRNDGMFTPIEAPIQQQPYQYNHPQEMGNQMMDYQQNNFMNAPGNIQNNQMPQGNFIPQNPPFNQMNSMGSAQKMPGKNEIQSHHKQHKRHGHHNYLMDNYLPDMPVIEEMSAQEEANSKKYSQHLKSKRNLSSDQMKQNSKKPLEGNDDQMYQKYEFNKEIPNPNSQHQKRSSSGNKDYMLFTPKKEDQPRALMNNPFQNEGQTDKIPFPFPIKNPPQNQNKPLIMDLSSLNSSVTKSSGSISRGSEPKERMSGFGREKKFFDGNNPQLMNQNRMEENIPQRMTAAQMDEFFFKTASFIFKLDFDLQYLDDFPACPPELLTKKKYIESILPDLLIEFEGKLNYDLQHFISLRKLEGEDIYDRMDSFIDELTQVYQKFFPEEKAETFEEWQKKQNNRN
ncbi:MAG: hypothetical protein MJ252_05625 [archaeon]|nr:hypothetical protein [archaeon]